jgi:hypothetical protein
MGPSLLKISPYMYMFGFGPNEGSVFYSAQPVGVALFDES